MRKEYREIDELIYPSAEKTMSVIREDGYDGAHVYYIKNCTGYSNGTPDYGGTEQQVRFMMIDTVDSSVTPGIQNEQIAHILMDRVSHMSTRFPSAQKRRMIDLLVEFLELSKAETHDRLRRGVMGTNMP